MYVSMKDILDHANKHNYAVMACNSVNMEMARAVITAAAEMHSPIIINLGVGQMAKLAHPTEMVPLIKELAESVDVPVALNLDHGAKYEDEVKAINWGFSSVMVDCSSLPYEENVERVANIVALAHAKGICVEGELGHVGQANVGDNESIDLYTNVAQARDYVDRTGIDALAVAIGTAHGDYPKEQVIENPEFTVSGVDDEGMANAWTYYVNQLNASDRFISSLIDRLSKRDEDTIVVMFGDHLPTMGLNDSDMKSGDIYKTKYITWNNMGLPKEDADLYAYQLLANTTNKVDIHEGTIMNYHQTQMGTADEASYDEGLDLLQYDLLYGKRYSYNEADLYPASDLVMGIDKVTVTSAAESSTGDRVYVYGSNFTNWSKVYVNGEKVNTSYLSASMLSIDKADVEDGDTITVCQVGSSDTIFRTSENEVTFHSEGAGSTESESSAE